MSAELRILLIVGSISFCLYILIKIRNSRFRIEEATFWICFSVVLILISIFPSLLTAGADCLGVISPVNFVFLLIIFMLLLKIFLLSRKVSELEDKLKQLIQKLAKEKL